MVKRFKHILLVEDNKALSFLNRSILDTLQLAEQIHTAENGKEALEVIAAHGIPELIFLDINMPVMNGWEFLAAYKKLNPAMDKSVIVITSGIALDSQEEKIAKTIYNITTFYSKIFNKEDFLNLVESNFDKPIEMKYIYN